MTCMDDLITAPDSDNCDFLFTSDAHYAIRTVKITALLIQPMALANKMFLLFQGYLLSIFRSTQLDIWHNLTNVENQNSESGRGIEGLRFGMQQLEHL